MIAPIIRHYWELLQQEMRQILVANPDVPIDAEKTAASLFDPLPARLVGMLNRTMALELNVARLEGRLAGDTPAERFQNFAEQLAQGETALTLLQEYPVLARQIVTVSQQYVRFSLEFLHHLYTDWTKIQAVFGTDLGRLVGVEGGLGDRHREGRAVMVARFSSGFRMVYKPRPMAVDQHFQELLVWLNERGDQPPFYPLKIINCGEYGWSEFVAVSACSTTAALHRFYQRQGGYLALLYALEATDFHFENLIAAGEHPFLIDLEALFHPRLKAIGRDPLPVRAMGHSVLRIGLLPQRIGFSQDSEGVDLSGLGAASGQVTPMPVLAPEGMGTDEFQFVRKRVPMQEGHHRPVLSEGEINVLDYADDIERGFSAIYRLLLTHREALVAGPLAQFRQDKIRVILRPTQTYANILRESFHPDVLRDALDRDRLFDRLWTSIVVAPHLAQVIPFERRDLYNGDVPLFITRTDSQHLWSSDGRQIQNYFTASGLETTQERLRQLSESDLERQIWFIHAALTTLATNIDEAVAVPQRKEGQASAVTRDSLMAMATAVGDRLSMLALREADEAAWLGVSLVYEKHWKLAPIGLDLYGGMPGIAIFLAYLGHMTGNGRYTQLAHATLNSLQKYFQIGQTFPTIGGFSGWGGIIYTLTHLGVLWQDEALLAQAEEIVGFLGPLIERDEILDIIGGAAGCIGTLLSLYEQRPSEITRQMAVRCGDHLLNRAKLMPQGAAWPTEHSKGRALVGFSHGAGGIAWALSKLASVTGEHRFAEMAAQGLAYERSLFSPEEGNWPDLRELADPDGKGTRFMSAWCHGAPGIGLSRLNMLPYLDDAAMRAEIEVAVQTTIKHGFGRNHSLCHGDLGNLELLLQAARRLDDGRLDSLVAELTGKIVGSMEVNGWLCGVPLGVETPGFMMGLAGIGYGLLRLAEPSAVPSIMMLEPPR